ncbi:MAG TPA: coniferyl-alcohol dehydrogenase [Steroidobacteraceae bacterium]|nr:coniferyl-alcohol dehydrogenase [Steroidobacteraceae bacterium]
MGMMDLNDLLQYRSKRVVVSGCYSGMGCATAQLLLDLGAEVHGLDCQQSTLRLASFRRVDLRDRSSIDEAIGQLNGPFDVLFNCAGLGPTFSPLDIMKVNFIGTRHLTMQLLPMIADGGVIGSIASTAAMGWARRIPVHKQLLAVDGYDEAVRWCEQNNTSVAEGYTFSKEAIVIWTMTIAQQLVISRGIRANCVLPGLTQTPMLENQIAVKTRPEILDDVIKPMGRAAQPQEQAFPLVMISSSAASYINGAALNVDGGRLATLAMR